MVLKPPDRAPIGIPVGQADLEYAAKKLLNGEKDVVVSNVRIEVFDLLDPEDREKCKKVEKELYTKIYLGVITLTADRTDIMQRSDGSTTWMRLLKWIEYTTED